MKTNIDLDKLLLSKSEDNTIDLGILWGYLQQLLIPTWSSDRTVYNEKPLGDAWPLHVLTNQVDPSGTGYV
jgi:hypothetical protein